VGNDNSVTCGTDPGFNACGGCGAITGGTLGVACGCGGTYVCNGKNATRCNELSCPGTDKCCGAGMCIPSGDFCQ
jgi:hypothetical protein